PGRDYGDRGRPAAPQCLVRFCVGGQEPFHRARISKTSLSAQRRVDGRDASMKFASYLVRGEPSFGAVIDGGIVDLKKRLGAQLSSLRSVLAQDALDGARAAPLQQQPDYRLDEVQLRPVIPDPEKILCVGLNYHSHRQETGRPETEFPSLFVRFPST